MKKTPEELGREFDEMTAGFGEGLEKEDQIIEGDAVRVNFNNAKYTLSREATVLHVPNATGDSWGFKDVISGDVHYVSEGCTITKVYRLTERS